MIESGSLRPPIDGFAFQLLLIDWMLLSKCDKWWLPSWVGRGFFSSVSTLFILAVSNCSMPWRNCWWPFSCAITIAKKNKKQTNKQTKHQINSQLTATLHSMKPFQWDCCFNTELFKAITLLRVIRVTTGGHGNTTEGSLATVYHWLANVAGNSWILMAMH